VTYDVIVAGLGAMGSATAFHLAGRKGLRVLALDRHHPPHTLGSTHGGTRIIRETSFEHPRYVPLVRRAYECWRRMEVATGKRLLRVTGGVFIGTRHGTFVAKSKESADIHKVPYEILSPAEIRRRFPAFRPDESAVGFYEPGAGVLGPETCVQACLDYAKRGGIDVKFDEPVTRWSVKGGGVTVTTPRGTYSGGKLLLAAGPWMLDTLQSVGVRVAAERIVMHWFAPSPPPRATSRSSTWRVARSHCGSSDPTRPSRHSRSRTARSRRRFITAASPRRRTRCVATSARTRSRRCAQC